MHDYILLLHDSAVPASPCACLESGFALEWYGTPRAPSINMAEPLVLLKMLEL